MDLTQKNSLVEAYEFMESNMSNKWADSTKRSYRKTVTDIETYMSELNLEPSLENVDFNFVKKWENNLYEFYAEKSINQKIAVMTSLFKFLRDAGVITMNPFSTLSTTNNDQYAAHSRELSLEELYQVYKTAHLLEAKGIPVLQPTLVALFVGFRNVTLTKIKVKNLDFKKSELQFKLKDNQEKYNSMKDTEINNKIKELVVPLPPKLMALLKEHTDGLGQNDNLLYGLRGKPLANKQMNYITKLICEELKWTNTDDNKDSNNKTMPFTPHGFRYTIATLFSEMGVEDQSIRHVLGHSNFERGNLRIYIKSYNKNVKQIRTAQQLLETLFSTTFEIETKYNLKIDLDQIFESIDIYYQNALLNKEYLEYFKGMLINQALNKISEQMFLQVGNQANNQMFQQQMPLNSMHMQNYYNQPYYHTPINPYQMNASMMNQNPYMSQFLGIPGAGQSYYPMPQNPYNNKF